MKENFAQKPDKYAEKRPRLRIVENIPTPAHQETKEKTNWVRVFDRKAEKASRAFNKLIGISLATTIGIGAIKEQTDRRTEEVGRAEGLRMYEQMAKKWREESVAMLHHDLNETSPELKAEMKEVQDQYGFEAQITRVMADAERPQETYGGLSLRQYVEQQLFTGLSEKELPSHIQEEISRFLRGWITKESMFNPHAKNKNRNASYDIGLFQLNTETLGDFGISGDAELEEVRLDLSRQLELVSKITVFKYRELKENAGSALNWIAREYCNGNEEEFDRYVLTPLLLLSWNAGHKRVSDLVNEFMERYKNDPHRPELAGYGIVQHIISTTKNERFTDVGRGYLAGIFGYEDGITRWHTGAIKLTKEETSSNAG